ncbi:hypothetical protein CCR81_06200 [Halorhodospira halophila]|nr:hypothetical protein [Halorhodospira halophila]
MCLDLFSDRAEAEFIWASVGVDDPERELHNAARIAQQHFHDALHLLVGIGQTYGEADDLFEDADNSKARLSWPRQPARSSKVGRNEPCPCGSGRKHKRCCGDPRDK